MSENQPEDYRQPIVAGEYDSAERQYKGLPSVGVKNNTPEGSPSVAGVENNSENPSAFRKIGQAAAKAARAMREAYAEHIGVDARKNDDGLMGELGFPGNTENPTNNSGALEGSADTSKSSANKPEADDDEDDIPAYLRPRKKTSDGTKSTSVEQASNAKPEAKEGKVNTPQVEKTSGGTKSTPEKQAPSANKPEAEKSKVNTPDKSVDTSGDKPNYYSLDDLIYEDVPKSKANEILRKAYGTAHEPKTLDELIDNPNISKNVVNEILDRVYGSSPEKSDQKDGVNSAKGGQESSTAESSKDNQAKDLNSEDATYVDDTPTEKIDLKTYEAATNLKLARMRFSKASIAVESHFFKKFFGGKKRQEELNAATEELKKCELEYMRLKFADKIEAAKQDPEKQAELAAEMGQAALANMRETSRTTTDKYDDMLDDRNIFKKAAAKVGKVFNNGGKIAQTLKLGSAGFVVGTATGLLAGTAGWPITAAVGVVTKLGVAGATKQAILEEYRGEDRTGYASLGTIDPSFEKAVANMKIDDVMEHAVNVSVDNLKDVSVERQDALQKKVLWSLGKYATGFILGGVVGSFIGDYLWDNNSAHAAGAESQKTSATPQQSGSGQIPQQPSGASSMDNSIAKAVNNINLDTSNFNSYDYPWDWAAEKFGNANAMDQLHNLADKAMADGHTVQWFDGPGGTWLKVDGSSVTADVLQVLNQYV